MSDHLLCSSQKDIGKLPILEWKGHNSSFIILFVEVFQDLRELYIFIADFAMVVVELIIANAEMFGGDMHQRLSGYGNRHSSDKLLDLMASPLKLMVMDHAGRFDPKLVSLPSVLKVCFTSSTASIDVPIEL